MFLSDALAEQVELVTTSRPVPVGGPCVYFLIEGDEVVYVGSSTGWADESVAMHMRSRKVFSRYTVIACETAEAAAEAKWLYVMKLRPKYNTQLGKLPPELISRNGLKAQGYRWQDVKKAMTLGLITPVIDDARLGTIFRTSEVAALCL
ncbi:hypothetical protein [Burkholderia sp. AU6039]|uniref:hypothetical protein n=1 Tax=Burkholderia sp. AU6039 TaxID=2015344 RepID=UPI000B7A02D0|nr:hypothetical protein [Burkholderia sp. AU6039]OXJ21305.1 hypothetical protein CFB39_01260 [Burkholderia sp. AU6039]